LKKSIETVGVIESFTVSKDDKIITGNARQEKISEVLGIDVEPIIVETDGTRPVVLKRTDIESGTKQFHEAALLANTTAKKNINLDLGFIQEIAVEEFDIDVEEIGVEIIDVDLDLDVSDFIDYHPNLNPEKQNGLVSDNDIDKAQRKIDDRFDFSEKQKTVICVCPDCGHEFEIKYE
jgi:hypothetical protein